MFRFLQAGKEIDKLNEDMKRIDNEIVSFKETLSNMTEEKSIADEIGKLQKEIEMLDQENILLKEALFNTTEEVKALKDEIARLIKMAKKK